MLSLINANSTPTYSSNIHLVDQIQICEEDSNKKVSLQQDKNELQTKSLDFSRKKSPRQFDRLIEQMSSSRSNVGPFQSVNFLHEIGTLSSLSKNDLNEFKKLDNFDQRNAISSIKISTHNLLQEFSSNDKKREKSNEKSLIRRQRRLKAFSKVTFDDSLNTDIVYDPDVVSLNFIKSDKSSEIYLKKKFISVYSSPQLSFEKEQDHTEKEEYWSNFQFKPNKENYDKYFRINYDLQSHKDSNKLVKTSSRISKMSEKQASDLFETRKKEIFRGLKQLKRKYSTPMVVRNPTQGTFSRKKRLIDSKNEIPRSFSLSQEDDYIKLQFSEHVENTQIKNL